MNIQSLYNIFKAMCKIFIEYLALDYVLCPLKHEVLRLTLTVDYIHILVSQS